MSKIKIWAIIVSSGVVASLATAAIFYPANATLLNSASGLIAVIIAVLTGYELKKTE